MIKVNGIEFNFDNSLLELNYNINEIADKQYTWIELKTILSRIPSNYSVLYDTGCIWDTKNKVKYIFDTFSETPVFVYDFKNSDVDEHIFSVLSASDFGIQISTMEYINQLDKIWDNKSASDSLIVEYFNLVLIKTK